MTSTSQAGTGPFLLKLCHLSAPVSIRPPESPHLKPFSFFVGRTGLPDGSQELSLNMGYFETLAEAQKWLRIVRGRYPHAVAMPIPAAFLPQLDAAAPRSQPDAAGSRAAKETLTDTQVMRILETRGVGPGAQIPLVRPEDTGTRCALQEAVARGVPVFFAVQLQWSAQPIDPGHVRSLGAFKDHVLYVTQSTRDGRSRYFLRLGFFADPVAARQVAFQVRTKFTAAVIVPVAEQERTQAYEPYSASPVAVNAGRNQPTPAQDSRRKPGHTARSKSANGASRSPRKDAETLDQTLELLAKREMWTDPDTVSESGVRHLKVEVQERGSGRP